MGSLTLASPRYALALLVPAKLVCLHRFVNAPVNLGLGRRVSSVVSVLESPIHLAPPCGSGSQADTSSSKK